MEEEGFFCVRWNSHNGILMSTLQKFLESGTLTDVFLSCEGSIISSHRLILAASSYYFAELFQQNKHNCSSSFMTISFKDIKMKEMRSILNFIYKGEVFLAERDIPGFLKAADALKIKGIVLDGTDTYYGNSQDKSATTATASLTKSPAVPGSRLSEVSVANGFLENSGTTTSSSGKDSAINGDITSACHMEKESDKDCSGERTEGQEIKKPGSAGRKLLRYKQYSKADYKKAVDQITKGKMKPGEASLKYGIPVRTLYSRKSISTGGGGTTKKQRKDASTSLPDPPPSQQTLVAFETTGVAPIIKRNLQSEIYNDSQSATENSNWPPNLSNAEVEVAESHRGRSRFKPVSYLEPHSGSSEEAVEIPFTSNLFVIN